MSRAVLGIDPGTRKTGYALVADAASPSVALGGGTNVRILQERLSVLGVPIHIIDETDTTYRARALYFAENPPKGWRRLIPLGLQLPPRPIDDYAALLIARRYIGRGGGAGAVV